MKLKMNVARAYKSPYEAEPTPCTLLCVSARYTPEAGLYVERGDIKDGVFYPCKPDIFAKTYESATLTPPNEPLISGFDVIDTKTGEYPDLWEIALKEDWANGLMYCDMEGFAIEEDGTLLLLDECGEQAYCPEGRFKIVPRPPEGEEDT